MAADGHLEGQWAQQRGFHAQLIPHAVVGVVIGPFLVMAIWASQTNGNAHWPSAIDIVLGIPLGLLLGYAVGLGMQRQRLKMQRWANARGWTYARHGKSALHSKVSHAEELKHFSTYWKLGIKSSFMTRRVDGRGACIHLATHANEKRKNTKNSFNNDQPKCRTFLIFDGGTECGHVVIHPHHMTDAIDLPGGMQSIKFELNEFNKQWTVKGTDPKSAYDRISQKTIDYLMQHGTDYAIEFKGGLVVVSSSAANYRSFPTLMGYATGLTRVIADDLLPLFEFLEHEHATEASKDTRAENT